MEHVEEQFTFLIDACDRFDGGEEHYAKQIAATLRILLHETPKSHALLAQIGKLHQLPLLDSAGPMSKTNILTISGLATLDPTTGRYFALGGQYQARRSYRMSSFGKLVEPPIGRTLRFDEWWTMPVIKDNKRDLFSRKDLVLGVANQDGGSHVDPEVDDAYYRLSRSNSLAWQIKAPGEEYIPAESPVGASLRQIAHELLHSSPHGWHSGVEY